MPPIPRDGRFDGTLALIADPYGFIATRCRRHGADLFQTRILLRPTICLTGPEAAELFSDEARFVRRGAMPGRILDTLIGRGGVQGLDDDVHRHRKQMFLSLMTPERVDRLATMTADAWQAAIGRWAAREWVVLYDAMHPILTRAVCDWAGVPLAPGELGLRTRQVTLLFDGAGAVGLRHWRARLARRRADRWAAGIVEDIRAGRIAPPAASAASVIAWHRDLDGNLLSPRVAAVELLNVVRPTVAVSVFITFVAHALHEHPECRQRLAAGDPDYPDLFVQEVRRFYPFFPMVAARVRDDFSWRGYRFRRGRRALLDLDGTDHDPRAWDDPEAFRPDRFRGWDENPFTFIPQGPGDHARNHRCPGEWITVALMKVAVDVLSRRIAYEVPDQDLRIDRSRLPALPRSRFVIANVRTNP